MAPNAPLPQASATADSSTRTEPDGPAPDTTTQTIDAGTKALSVLVLTGTSEHPFDRVISWVDRWHRERAGQGADLAITIQRGTSTTPCLAASVEMLKVDDLAGLASEADVIICHGGPGTIHDALMNGVRPIICPRSGALGEHVDDHQMRFAGFLERTAGFDVGWDEAELHRQLDQALENPDHYRQLDTGLGAAAADALSVGDRITELVTAGRRVGRRSLRRRFRTDTTQPKVLVVSSSGGHLRQVWRLMPWLERGSRHWVTFGSADATSLLADESMTVAYSPTTRNIPNLIRNTFLSWRVLRRERPDVLISSGAGVAVPFFWLSRLLGIPTVYIEVFDRVDSTTMTGRLCEPVTDLFMVQWDEQLGLYRNSVSVGHLL